MSLPLLDSYARMFEELLYGCVMAKSHELSQCKRECLMISNINSLVLITNFDLLPHWMCQHVCLKKAFVHITTYTCYI